MPTAATEDTSGGGDFFDPFDPGNENPQFTEKSLFDLPDWWFDFVMQLARVNLVVREQITIWYKKRHPDHEGMVTLSDLLFSKSSLEKRPKSSFQPLLYQYKSLYDFTSQTPIVTSIHLFGAEAKSTPPQNKVNDEDFVLAARHGEIGRVKAMIAKGTIDINSTEAGDRTTALHRAVMHGHLDIVKLLLAQPGIRLDLKDRFGNDPLHVAVQFEQYQALRLLLDREDLDVNTFNSAGHTALYMAAEKGYQTAVRKLLKRNDLDVKARSLPARPRAAFAHTIAEINGHSKIAQVLRRFFREKLTPQDKQELRSQLRTPKEKAAAVGRAIASGASAAGSKIKEGASKAGEKIKTEVTKENIQASASKAASWTKETGKSAWAAAGEAKQKVIQGYNNLVYEKEAHEISGPMSLDTQRRRTGQPRAGEFPPTEQDRGASYQEEDKDDSCCQWFWDWWNGTKKD